MSSLASASDLVNWISGNLSAQPLYTGAIALQGGHQVVKKSTTVNFSQPMSSLNWEEFLIAIGGITMNVFVIIAFYAYI